jgi:hypothetical protein
MISPSVVVAAEAVNHVGGWGPTTWFWHLFFSLAGWAAIGAPVYIMHRLETEEAEQAVAAAAPVPAAGPVPVVSEEPKVVAWPYMVLAFALGLAGTVTAAALSWFTVRHLDSTFLVIVWWMLPFVCCVAVWMYWLLEDRQSDVVRSRSGWAAALAGLVYAALGVAIAGADLITRLAATVELASDALIVLVLLGLLGWALWVVAPRRRRS